MPPREQPPYGCLHYRRFCYPFTSNEMLKPNNDEKFVTRDIL